MRKQIKFLFSVILTILLLSSTMWATDPKRKSAPIDPAVAEALAEARRAREEAETMRATYERKLAEFETRINHLEAQLAHQQSPEKAEGDKNASETKSPQFGDEDSPAEPNAEVLNRIATLEDGLNLAHARLLEHSQTRVESGEKFGIRLFGMLLFNAGYNSSGVEDKTVGIFTLPKGAAVTNNGRGFTSTMRQTTLGLAFVGPQFGKAKLTADIAIDLFGGTPATYNGTTYNLIRLRTARIKLDFGRGALIAGQDVPVISPLNPTSLASVGFPALADSGNLWSWVPQIKGEYQLIRKEHSALVFEAAALAPLTGFEPEKYEFFNEALFPESSRMPALEARLSFNRGQRNGDYFGSSLGSDAPNFGAGIGVHYGRQKVFGQVVNSTVVSGDYILPINKKLSLSGEFFWGRSLAGLGGGIQQGLVIPGEIASVTSGARLGSHRLQTTFDSNDFTVRGVRSMGGWAQLKYVPITKVELNFAYGADDPYNKDLINTNFSEDGGGSRSLNRTAFVNWIYHYRSNFIIAAEYRYNQTFYTASRANTNHSSHFDFALGYKF